MDDTLFLLIAVIFLVFMIVFSNRRRKRAAEDLKSRVVVGAQVMLTSGIYGKVLELSDDRMVIETAPKQQLTVALGAVRSIEAEPKPKPASKPAPKKTK